MSNERRDKGTGSMTERNGRWEARYGFTNAAGKRLQRSASFDKKTEARQWLTARLAEVADGQSADAGSITVGEYFEEWLGSLGMAELEAATISWYRSAVQSHIIPRLGRVKLSRLTPTMVEAFLAEKRKSGHLGGKGKASLKAGNPLGPASVRRLHVTLRKACDAAVRKGLLNRNPVDLADKPKVQKADATIRVWTPAEIVRFIQATSTDRLAALWRLDAMTGLR
nr:hypothetical protein [Actinomycetota bacterium]